MHGAELTQSIEFQMSLLLFVALAGYLLMLTTRTTRITRLVHERTATIRKVTLLQQAILDSAAYTVFGDLGNAASCIGALALVERPPVIAGHMRDQAVDPVAFGLNRSQEGDRS